MSYIFDGFPSREAADRFCGYMLATTAMEATAYAERRDDLNPFPYDLVPPVVYMDRIEPEPPGTDEVLSDAAKRFGGRYAGT